MHQKKLCLEETKMNISKSILNIGLVILLCTVWGCGEAGTGTSTGGGLDSSGLTGTDTYDADYGTGSVGLTGTDTYDADYGTATGGTGLDSVSSPSGTAADPFAVDYGSSTDLDANAQTLTGTSFLPDGEDSTLGYSDGSTTNLNGSDNTFASNGSGSSQVNPDAVKSGGFDDFDSTNTSVGNGNFASEEEAGDTSYNSPYSASPSINVDTSSGMTNGSANASASDSFAAAIANENSSTNNQSALDQWNSGTPSTGGSRQEVMGGRNPDNNVLTGSGSNTGQLNEIPEYVNDRKGWVGQSQTYWNDYKDNLGNRVESGELSPAGATVRHTFATVGNFLTAPLAAVENSAGKLGHDVGHGADGWTITKDSAALAGNSLLAGATLYPGASLLRGGKVATTGGRQVFSRAQQLEYQALRRQGYQKVEAKSLMSQFDKGINPGNNWAYHYTNKTAAGKIVKSGEIWKSKRALRGQGTYAGTISNATGFQKLTRWYLTPGSANVRIPINRTLQSGVVDDVVFPANTAIFRDGVRFAN